MEPGVNRVPWCEREPAVSRLKNCCYPLSSCPSPHRTVPYHAGSVGHPFPVLGMLLNFVSILCCWFVFFSHILCKSNFRCVADGGELWARDGWVVPETSSWRMLELPRDGRAEAVAQSKMRKSTQTQTILWKNTRTHTSTLTHTVVCKWCLAIGWESSPEHQRTFQALCEVTKLRMSFPFTFVHWTSRACYWCDVFNDATTSEHSCVTVV